MSGCLPRRNCQSPVAHSCSLLNHPNSFHGGLLKLNTTFDADSLFYMFSHFECYGHTVHMLTQWPLMPPLIRTVKSSFFTLAHSNPPSLPASLHQCQANHFHYISMVGHFPDSPEYIYNINTDNK